MSLLGFREPGRRYDVVFADSRWAVDETEEERVVIIRFWDETMDEVLASVADKPRNFAVIYLVDISKDEIPDFNTMYELYDSCTVRFFYQNNHIKIDLGTGNNNKINWAMNDKQECIIDMVVTCL